MKGIYLVNYTVKGIKSLDEEVSLSFYKKTITSDPKDFQNYNIKGIYGINGSGKSAIVTSVKIFKNLIINKDYLNNPLIQSYLRELINKNLLRMDFSGDFFAKSKSKSFLFHYEISISSEKSGKIVIDREALSYKAASSRQEDMKPLFEVNNGKIAFANSIEQDFCDYIIDKTKNLLKTATVSSFFIDYILDWKDKKVDVSVFEGIMDAVYVRGLVICLSGSDRMNMRIISLMELWRSSIRKQLTKAINSIQKVIRDVKELRVKEISVSRRKCIKKELCRLSGTGIKAI